MHAHCQWAVPVGLPTPLGDYAVIDQLGFLFGLRRATAHQIARSWEGRTSRRLPKKIEMLFARLKRILKLDRLRLRGANDARDDFILAATARNLHKMAKLIPMPALRPT